MVLVHRMLMNVHKELTSVNKNVTTMMVAILAAASMDIYCQEIMLVLQMELNQLVIQLVLILEYVVLILKTILCANALVDMKFLEILAQILMNVKLGLHNVRMAVPILKVVMIAPVPLAKKLMASPA